MTAIAPAFAPHDIASVSGPSPAGRRRAYAQARRHSARVRLFKVAIPAGAILGSALVLGAMFYNPFSRMNLTLGPISVSGTKVAMERPRLTGFKKDARPYEVTATAAYQDIRKPTVIELKDMRARMVMDESGAAAHLVSTMGVFDTNKEMLDLSQDVRITTDRGEEALLKSASIDFKAGTVLSREAVRITTGNGRIEAAGLQISDSGKTISFEGRVRAVINRVPGDASADAAGRYTDATPGDRP